MLQAFDSLLDSVIALDQQFNVIYFNEAFANLVELPRRKIKMGKNINDLIKLPPPVFEKISFNSDPYEASTYLEYTFFTATERSIACQISGQIVMIDSFPAYLIFIHDVTLEQSLHDKYKTQLAQKEDYISQLNRKLFEAQFLFEIASIINSDKNDGRTISKALNKTAEVFRFSRGYFISNQIEEHRSTLRIENAVAGIDDGEGSDSDLDTDLIFLIEQEMRSKSEGKKSHTFLRNKIRYIIVKVESQNLLLGYLVFQKKSTAELWSNDLELLQVMSGHLSASLENEILYRKSITDEKTGLYNPRFFSDSIAKEFKHAAIAQTKLGLMMIDIDYFKKFNDTYGHQLGDQVIRYVATRLKVVLRPIDIASRFGGEEFAIILPDITSENLYLIAEKLRMAISSSGVQTEEHGTLKVTVSIGVAYFPDHSTSEKNLIEFADKALYHAKRSGRNNVKVFSADLLVNAS